MLQRVGKYEKGELWKEFENYEKNRLCIEDVAGRVLRHMKGHGVSFGPEITDGNGNFSQEKLLGFVEKLLSGWAQQRREGTFTDPSTGESMAEPYIRKRWELYGSYLYMVMRCSLLGEMNQIVGSHMKDVRTDFAFLLEQARRLLEDWCVMEEPDGGRKNDLFWGYDRQFGLHLYGALIPDGRSLDQYRELSAYRAAFLTDEGSVKRSRLKSYGVDPALLAAGTKETAQPDEAEAAGDGRDMEESEEELEENDEYFEFDDSLEDAWLLAQGIEPDEMAEYRDMLHESLEAHVQKQRDLSDLDKAFKCQGEYLRECERFVRLFGQAEPDVLRGLCDDFEEIVELYLVRRGLPPLMDTDKTMNVYGSIYDKVLPLAKRYERGIQWKIM